MNETLDAQPEPLTVVPWPEVGGVTGIGDYCAGTVSASFDNSNLVSRAGLVPVMALAERAGLVREHVRIAAKTGAFAEVKGRRDGGRGGLDR